MDEGSTPDADRAQRTAAAVEDLRRALCAAQDGAVDAAERERQAREELVLANVQVAQGIARRYRNSHEPMEELVQTAYLGLVKASNGYVPDRSHDFLSYAVPTIGGEVKRYFRDQGGRSALRVGSRSWGWPSEAPGPISSTGWDGRRQSQSWRASWVPTRTT